MQRPPEEIVLHALRTGMEVTLVDGSIINMDERHEIRQKIKRIKFSTPPVEDWIWVGTEFTVGMFIRECRSLPEAYVTELAMNVVLNEVKEG